MTQNEPTFEKPIPFEREIAVLAVELSQVDRLLIDGYDVSTPRVKGYLSRIDTLGVLGKQVVTLFGEVEPAKVEDMTKDFVKNLEAAKTDVEPKKLLMFGELALDSLGEESQKRPLVVQFLGRHAYGAFKTDQERLDYHRELMVKVPEGDFLSRSILSERIRNLEYQIERTLT